MLPVFILQYNKNVLAKQFLIAQPLYSYTMPADSKKQFAKLNQV